MVVSTGAPVIDEMLGGGLPERRTVLVIGGPGTGKSTLGVQFLQDGLDAGESCLFISTEQTEAEIADSFADFPFTLDDDGLELATIHASMGRTMESDVKEPVLRTLSGEEPFDGIETPYEPEYITRFLRQFTPVDRVLLDSVSGLATISDSTDIYRRAILDLIRAINTEFEATALFTAEETQRSESGNPMAATPEALQFNTHGIIRLTRTNVSGDTHRYIEIPKMRGVDHDTRRFELEIGPTGIRAIPRNWNSPLGDSSIETVATGVEGLDELLGGGIPHGASVLFEHDGHASPHVITTQLLRHAMESDNAVTIVPPVELPQHRLEETLERHLDSVEDRLMDDQLFVIDCSDIWHGEERNIFKPTRDASHEIWQMFDRIDERRGDRPMLSLVNLEAFLPHYSAGEIRKVRFSMEKCFQQTADTAMYVVNPATVSDQIVTFYENSAWQIVKTWMTDDGLQYLKLTKSQTGPLGSMRLVEYRDREPTVRIQRLPEAVQR